jgi:TMEM199 family protein
MQSFEPELQETLRPLLTLIPSKNASTLENYLKEAKLEDKPQIPYVFLKEISQWAQANSELLPLPTERYTMISLLAGSVSSPRSYFPPLEPTTQSGRESISQTTKDITTLLNCAITIVGAGFAAWFASSKAGWRYEWVSFLASVPEHS